MNLLTIRNPTRVGWSDSCPSGLGGFTQGGRAWRVHVPEGTSFRGEDRANNILEFLGMVVTILLLIDESQEEESPCLLALGDNTSAIGWLFKSGKLDPISAYYLPAKFIARHLARKVIEGKVQIASQHLAGRYNDVADLLSFEGEDRGKTNSLTLDCPPNDILTSRILSNYSQLVPKGFRISNLPPEISAFTCQAMLTIELSWIRDRKKGIGRQNGSGTGGQSSLEKAEAITPYSIEFPETSGSSFSNASLSESEKGDSTRAGDMWDSVRSRWLLQLCRVPQATWLRRFGSVTGTAPCTSQDDPTGQEAWSSP